MNDLNKCAECAKAMATGGDSLCVLLEKTNQTNIDNFWSERQARFRAVGECDKLAGRVMELENERDALKAEIRGLEIRLDSAKSLRDGYKADFFELRRAAREMVRNMGIENTRLRSDQKVFELELKLLQVENEKLRDEMRQAYHEIEKNWDEIDGLPEDDPMFVAKVAR